jgi:hypothetical protein
MEASRIEAAKWVAIVGSSNPVPYIEQYAVKCVDKALQQGNFIMFGDSPKGTDWAILQHLDTVPKIARMQFCICTAVGEQPRNMARLQGQDFSSKRRFEDYQNRDFNMVDFADVTMCLWDGSSKNAKSVFEYAQTVQRQAYLVTWNNNKLVLESSL